MGIKSKKYRIIKNARGDCQILRFTKGIYKKKRDFIKQLEEFLQQAKDLLFIELHEKDLFNFALKNACAFGIPLEKLGVHILDDELIMENKKLAINSVFNTTVIMKIMKTFLNENEGSTTAKFELDNPIINSIGKTLFKSKIWRK